MKYSLELSYSDPKFWYNRTLDTNSQEWKELRQIILNRDNWTCSFCDIRLAKYMIVDHIDGDGSNNDLSNLRLNCPACDKIRHCGLAGLKGEICLVVSKLSQVEIVQHSQAFFLKNNRNPQIKEIDKKGILINPYKLSCFEVAKKRSYQDQKINERLKDFKGFFTEKMDFSYLRWIIEEER